jgi:hypothetical protein
MHGETGEGLCPGAKVYITAAGVVFVNNLNTVI